VTRSVQELPEQTIEASSKIATDPAHDLEEAPGLEDEKLFGKDEEVKEPQVNTESNEDDENSDTGDNITSGANEDEDEGETQKIVLKDNEPEIKQAKPDLLDFHGVKTESPQHTKIVPSGIWASGESYITNHMPQGFQSKLMKNREHKPRTASRAARKTHYDSAEHREEAIKFTSGGYQINIHQNHAKNFLDARRVQVGTSLLGAHSGKNAEDRVARFRVYFLSPFEKRPIVIVTTVPEGSEKRDDRGPHPDVFAASVSEIRLDHFVVSVVRVDSFPNNEWGQSLYLDWIALEYQSEYPGPTYGGSFLPTYPAFSDLEHDQSADQNKEIDLVHSWDD
jgi:hypothetical protein